MNGTSRAAVWRLVAMIGLVWTIAAASAYAQGVRVKIGPASIYERARTSSDVMITVPEDTVLEMVRREGDWYWVMLPPDANGTRRGGYILVYLCERLGDKRLPEPGIPGTPGRGVPAEFQPKAEAAAKLPRVFVGLSAGGQFGSARFTDNVAFRLYQEAGQFDASYRVKNDTAFDTTIGVRLAEQFVLAFAFWRTTPTTIASATAKVPHPLQSYRPRTASGTAYGVSRSETDGHLQITYLVPVSRRVDLSIFAGPSVFYLRQSLVSSFGYREAYPYDAVVIDGFATAGKTKLVVGAHVGADVSVMLWRFVGVGLGGRYARGSLNLPSAGNGSIPVEVGGTQVMGGLRLRF